MSFQRIALLFFLCFTQSVFGDLQSQIHNIVLHADLNKGSAGVCIVDSATNEILVDINSKNGMIPASNQKLLTAGAALHVLGPNFTFRTVLLQDGNNLIVVGDGDPTFGDTELLGVTDWSDERGVLEAELVPWIEAVQQAEMSSIDTIYIDDRIFDQNFVHPSWPADQINNWYCAQVAGINYHLNVVHFFPSPNKGTNASLGNYTPSLPWIVIKNRTSSKTGKNSSSSFWIARSPNTNVLTARGNVNATHTKPVKVSFHDPSMIFGNTLASALRAEGISVQQVKRVDEQAVSQGEELYVRTTPISRVLLRSNRDSHNLYAETLLKRLSAAATHRSGTFDEGAAIVEAAVTQRLQTNQRGFSPSDGSGMSRDNSVSPKTLAKWLASFQLDEPSGEALLHSLATPGVGTLENRFSGVELENAEVYAKSGYLRGVCSLSGYIVFEDNRAPIAFSIIVNNIKGTVKGAKRMQEQIIAEVVRSAN
jgi:D-alanyl-D-alanine carboxypeptidase/D-alanyl-D-alanine-endopeptidase (penicillin-binding protein 4)